MFAENMKTKAKAAASPLKEAVAQLKNTRDSMVGLAFSARQQLASLSTDEGLEATVEYVGAPESRFQAPIGEGIARYVRNTTSQ
jgi:hypothetical protein